MGKTTEEILADIDKTLDQLITNASAGQEIAQPALFIEELALLQKTQESLLARLVDMQKMYVKTKGIQKSQFVSLERKLLRFGKLNAQFVHKIEHKIKQRLPRKKK